MAFVGATETQEVGRGPREAAHGMGQPGAPPEMTGSDAGVPQVPSLRGPRVAGQRAQASATGHLQPASQLET